MNRLLLALRAFWKILTDAAFASRVEPLMTATPTGPYVPSRRSPVFPC